MAKHDAHLVLVRHGRAEDEHPVGDGARGLTAQGRRGFRRLAKALRGELAVEGIATSPLVRAVQTAEILAGALKVRQVRIEADLAAGDARSVARLAARLGAGWALVGHNPTLSEAAARLTGEAGLVPLAKGEVLVLRARASGWEVVGRHPT